MMASTEPTTEVDFDVYYRVEGFGGVAFYLNGYVQRWRIPDAELTCEDDGCLHEGPWCWTDPEPEVTEDRDWVRAVMVGDDREHEIEVSILLPLAREEFCGQCGQIGCTHDGLDR